VSLDADDPTWPELLSHPGDGDRAAVALEAHLLGVARRARDVTPDDAVTGDGRSLHDAARIVGLAHDVGKATAWFQSHIGNDSVECETDGPSHHARLGGLLAYYALRARGYGAGACFAGLVAVAKHHGTLPNYRRFVEEHLDQRTTWRFGSADGARSGSYNGAAARQAAHVETTRPEFARAVVDELAGESGSWSDFLARLTASNDAIETVGDDPDESLLSWLRADFLYRFRPDTRVARDGETYLDELRLYGALTFADKSHAAGVSSEDPRIGAEPLAVDQVETHIGGLGGEEEGTLERQLNEVRGEIQEYVGGHSDRGDPVEQFLVSDARVATLTLPTGYGKTLAGTLTAARVREAIGGDRIVYALPFTSVVDQTADVLRDVCKSDDGDPALGRRLTVHHHLSEALTLADDETREETDEDAERAMMLAESWRSGVTLTTFVQLFESLAGPRNGQSTKLPALYESVVIVDEPQALPLTWWPLVDRLIDALVTEFDATVILMTATQPRIVDAGETVSLLDTTTLDAIEADVAPSLPDRVEYEFHPTALGTGKDGPEPLGHDDAATWLADIARESGSTLAVCNTIDSATALFEQVASELGADRRGPGPVDVGSAMAENVLRDGRVGTERRGTDGERETGTHRRERERAAFARAIARRASSERPAVVYLSTRLRPCDRQFLLGVVDELADLGVPLLVVSTQVVEAGVDLSFDRVIRDFAPLDSIVQAAGRCNRSFERAPETGRVVVWRLGPLDEDGTVPGEAVYARREGDTDLDLLAKTREALEGVATDAPVPESVVADASVGSYHETVGDAVASVAADSGLRQSFEGAAGTTLRQASLVEDHLTFEVYVCRTSAEYEVVRAYREAETRYDFETLEERRSQLVPLRVSIPVYDVSSDAARQLKGLEPLSMNVDRRDATERVLRTDHDERFFDARTGTDVPEDTVGGRFY
jgi:CRISPR-associated endonuclease/helicase Cas3/CRISPR-associated endonuclease Cas3-HD